nr:MAG TPA: hypothetical protein [Caudoviricetes sp.]DAQ66780.1 MAG TPA: hypothetical protein [Caudoviricetes sp.]
MSYTNKHKQQNIINLIIEKALLSYQQMLGK